MAGRRRRDATEIRNTNVEIRRKSECRMRKPVRAGWRSFGIAGSIFRDSSGFRASDLEFGVCVSWPHLHHTGGIHSTRAATSASGAPCSTTSMVSVLPAMTRATRGMAVPRRCGWGRVSPRTPERERVSLTQMQGGAEAAGLVSAASATTPQMGQDHARSVRPHPHRTGGIHSTRAATSASEVRCAKACIAFEKTVRNVNLHRYFRRRFPK